jgi:hypothetical protein
MFFVVISIAVACSAAEQQAVQRVDTLIPVEFAAKWQALQQELAPTARVKIDAGSRAIAPMVMDGTFTERAVLVVAQQQFPDLASMDIDSVMQLVMMACAADARADLRQMIDEMKKLKAQKDEVDRRLAAVDEALRRAPATNERPAPPATTTVGRAEVLTGGTTSRNFVQRRTPYLRIPYTEVQPFAMAGALDGKSGAELQALQRDLDSEKKSLSDLSTEEEIALQMAMDRMSKFMDILSNIMKKVADTTAGIVSNLK